MLLKIKLLPIISPNSLIAKYLLLFITVYKKIKASFAIINYDKSLKSCLYLANSNN